MLGIGKGEGMFDHLVHSSLLPVGTATGDVAADSYHRFKEDIAAARDLKVSPRCLCYSF